MKRVIALLLIVVFCFATVSCRSKAESDSASSDPSWNMISQKKQLVVGLASTRVPLAAVSTDGFEGFDIDLLKQVATRLNVSVSFVDLDGQEASAALSSGKVDCICAGYAYSADRNELLTLSDVYLTSRQVFAVSNAGEIKDLADLAGKTLGVASGSAAQTALSNSETFRAALGGVKEYDTEDAVMQALLGGEIDAAAVSETLLRHAILKGSDLRALLDEDNKPDTLGSENYVIAFSRGSDTLLKKVQDALATMKRDGVLDELSNKWFSNYLSAAEQNAANEAADAASAAQSAAEAEESPAESATE